MTIPIPFSSIIIFLIPTEFISRKDTTGFYSPIQAINLADSTVTILVYTNRHNLDGITEDNEGNVYISSWTTRSVYMYDSLFTFPPQFIYYNANAPADIFYDCSGGTGYVQQRRGFY
jgi:hypothetical protein